MTIPPIRVGDTLPDDDVVTRIENGCIYTNMMCADGSIIPRRYDPHELAIAFNDADYFTAQIRQLEQEKAVLVDALADCMGDLLATRQALQMVLTIGAQKRGAMR